MVVSALMVYGMDAPELFHLRKSGSWLDDTKSLDKVMLTVPSLLPDVERLKSMVLWESTKKDEEGLAAFLIDDAIRGNNVLVPLRSSSQIHRPFTSADGSYTN
jgi:hypothetical protein